MTSFKPMFNRAEALALAVAYKSDEDGPALMAGQAIANGDCSRLHLGTIFKWKTGDRGKSRIARNSDLEIADALGLAVAAKTPRSAVAVLVGLHGVQVPVASAILTAIRPSAYTVIDFRALEALKVATENRSIDFYLEYLTFCIQRARDWGMPLRDFDRALWQWSKDQSMRQA